MAFESAFLELMPHRIVVKRFSKATTAGSSAGSYGTATYTSAAASTYRGRMVVKNVKLVRPDGSEFSGNHVAWLATTATITRRDKVTFSGSTYEILQVGIFPDEDGVHHTRLILV
jgi:hypothetical protein